MIESFEELRTGRLLLEPMSGAVARAIARGDLSGLATAEGWPQSGTKNGVVLALERGQPPGWLVCHAGWVIGDCGIHAPVDAAGCVEIGYGLAPGYHGKGLGTEMVQAMSDWLLSRADVSRVRARTLPSNVASGRVLEKAGFVQVASSDELRVYERQA